MVTVEKDKTVTAKSRRLAQEALEMLGEPVLTTIQRLNRIEKEMRRQDRLKRKKRATHTADEQKR